MASSAKPDSIAPPSGEPVSSRSGPRCPRCGGLAETRKRRAGRWNPFLSKESASSNEVTCLDCGLDFDRQAESLRDPWAKT